MASPSTRAGLQVLLQSHQHQEMQQTCQQALADIHNTSYLLSNMVQHYGSRHVILLDSDPWQLLMYCLTGCCKAKTVSAE
jgi:hypothetical protein